jgi:hypothetical protein
VLKEEHTLNVFETTALKRILGFKREAVTGRERNMHNDRL